MQRSDDLIHPHDDPSPWAPLRNPIYRSFWIASLVSNLGTWMHEIGAGWLMTDLDASPQMVAAVRTAMAAPIVLLAIPAGVLADRTDRRKLLLATQTMLLLTTATLAVLTYSGAVTSWILLALTFVIGLGMTLHVPTWQASIPELVPRIQLSRAIALGSISFNLARALGPALAGILVALTGSWIAFSFNALSFAGVIVVLLCWKRTRSESTRGLSFALSLYQGLRYVARTVQMRNVLIRVMLFVIPASALWGLLPLVARERLQWGAEGFGILVTCVGAGAIIGARFLPKVQTRLGSHFTVLTAMLLFGTGLAVMGTSLQRPVVVVASLLMGCGWMLTLTTLNTTAQITLPNRMRARGMSCYLTAMAISMSSGSFLWGSVAESIGQGDESIGIGHAQKIAAATIFVTAAIGMCFRLSASTERHGR
ncbi:MFS transporter [Stieleria sp. TO1_6]|uniref:MFS transporter n=1 Tax=Stieleria tagensis TaxID=2956795 RepID=UPI00209B4840|nr:MFS transporter [Stieleria tagensis]MCO8124454.1 MFS transporter [Stieleria tagensis]